jgi:hypothetical protein
MQKADHQDRWFSRQYALVLRCSKNSILYKTGTTTPKENVTHCSEIGMVLLLQTVAWTFKTNAA